MDSVLPEWYSPDDDNLKEIITTGTIAFDTNVLLDLYRVGRGQREQILQVLADVRDRIFIPFQVAHEFQKKRLDVVLENEAVYSKLFDAAKPTEGLLNAIRDPEVRGEVKKLFARVTKPLEKGLKAIRDEHEISFDEVRGADPVRKALDELLADSSIGERPEEDTLEKRKAVAKERLDAKIPPGFKDEKKPDPSGDYLIWAELLEYATASNRPLLFVTGDKKSDWYRDLKGHTLGPRIELIAEMHEASPDYRYHQVDSSTFLWMAREYLDSDVEEETIETVRNITRRPFFDSDTLAKMYPGLGFSVGTQEVMNAALEAYTARNPDLVDVLRRGELGIAASLALGPDFQTQISEVLRKRQEDLLASYADKIGWSTPFGQYAKPQSPSATEASE